MRLKIQLDIGGEVVQQQWPSISHREYYGYGMNEMPASQCRGPYSFTLITTNRFHLNRLRISKSTSQ
jgi:hypothetical protein